eukprot:TRINITY_DN6587_c0_g3_i1.p1 TRINITY_DN6587_c0_g3~~TRINITY_DN6587_c0_g3_i1.p1  ORF type:complete len:499 (-),score=8.16 TRINITY_DN6587_c0_g3_i1:106-1422(-)
MEEGLRSYQKTKESFSNIFTKKPKDDIPKADDVPKPEEPTQSSSQTASSTQSASSATAESEIPKPSSEEAFSATMNVKQKKPAWHGYPYDPFMPVPGEGVYGFIIRMISKSIAFWLKVVWYRLFPKKPNKRSFYEKILWPKPKFTPQPTDEEIDAQLKKSFDKAMSMIGLTKERREKIGKAFEALDKKTDEMIKEHDERIAREKEKNKEALVLRQERKSEKLFGKVKEFGSKVYEKMDASSSPILHKTLDITDKISDTATKIKDSITSDTEETIAWKRIRAIHPLFDPDHFGTNHKIHVTAALKLLWKKSPLLSSYATDSFVKKLDVIMPEKTNFYQLMGVTNLTVVASGMDGDEPYVRLAFQASYLNMDPSLSATPKLEGGEGADPKAAAFLETIMQGQRDKVSNVVLEWTMKPDRTSLGGWRIVSSQYQHLLPTFF